ncbi:LacI family DNA-binding transcriptional regulator [Ruania alba]|uniref:Transcriptional regulator, LacI family n=1 Tax=Ruania alba TaxID=648782 RepID=A0A1H5GBW9_9MICO|nr:LacI family DNA-binding transcriptional regulator [Ruania alba]SEE13119.1 transcriptional regulator, LacI family [Ruania alba]
MSSPTRRPTIRDVAETAKVSRSTASRALTGRGYVAPAVRERVQSVAQELGYVPDITARFLKQQTSRSIGVLVWDMRNSFYGELASGISQESRKHGYSIILADDLTGPEAKVEVAERFLAMRVAGVIITPTSPEVTTYLAERNVPVVEVDRQFAAGQVDAVVVDNMTASRRATESLLAVGHERIALVIDEIDWTTGRDRLAGYQAALAAAGHDPDTALVVSAGWDVPNVYRAARELLSREDAPTAVFAANNVLAEGVWRAATDLGITIPDDLSLVAFDDAPWMTLVSPRVTAVAQDSVALGEIAVRQLLERIERPEVPARTIMLAALLRERESTAPPPERPARWSTEPGPEQAASSL